MNKVFVQSTLGSMPIGQRTISVGQNGCYILIRKTETTKTYVLSVVTLNLDNFCKMYPNDTFFGSVLEC